MEKLPQHTVAETIVVRVQLHEHDITSLNRYTQNKSILSAGVKHAEVKHAASNQVRNTKVATLWRSPNFWTIKPQTWRILTYQVWVQPNWNISFLLKLARQCIPCLARRYENSCRIVLFSYRIRMGHQDHLPLICAILPGHPIHTVWYAPTPRRALTKPPALTCTVNFETALFMPNPLCAEQIHGMHCFPWRRASNVTLLCPSWCRQYRQTFAPVFDITLINLITYLLMTQIWGRWRVGQPRYDIRLFPDDSQTKRGTYTVSKFSLKLAKWTLIASKKRIRPDFICSTSHICIN